VGGNFRPQTGQVVSWRFSLAFGVSRWLMTSHHRPSHEKHGKRTGRQNQQRNDTQGKSWREDEYGDANRYERG
jgi:hypothetical protein